MASWEIPDEKAPIDTSTCSSDVRYGFAGFGLCFERESCFRRGNVGELGARHGRPSDGLGIKTS